MDNFFVYLLLLLTLYVLKKHFVSKLQNLPPSPWLSLPVIGHLYLLKKPLHRTLSQISNQKGPILLFHFGSRPVVLVSSPSLAEECFTKNDIVFANRPRLAVGKHLAYNYTGLSWAPYGDLWRKLRRISSTHLLSNHRLLSLSPIRADEVKLLLRLLSSKQNQMLDIRTLFSELAVNVMMRLIAGKRYYGEAVADSEEVKLFREIHEETFRLIGVTNFGDFIPIMKWIGPRTEKRLAELHIKRERFLQSLVEQHRRRLALDDSNETEGRNMNMLEILLSLQKTEPEFCSDEMVRALAVVQLLGGADTSVNTMEWAMSLLLNHSKVLKKAQEEIDNIVGHERLITENDLARLPYIRAIINETLRMYIPGPLLMPHESSQDCTVGGYHVPRGTMLLVNMWAIQNDPKVWVDPEEFRPERFEGNEGMTYGFKFAPFGAGRRGCPGEGLAMCIIGLTLGSLIQCFDWEKVNEEIVDMRERSRFLSSRDQPLQAKCRLREGMLKVISQL